MDTIHDDSIPMPSIPSDASAAASVPKQRGYPVDIIINGKADEKFCCSYCKHILRNPMQSSCGHRFCQDCLKVMQSLPQPMQCQSCVEEGITDETSTLHFQEMFEDRAARREMKKLQVKCVYQGCPWKGSFNDFAEHEGACEKKMVNCSQCGARVSKARLNNHETKSCPKRVIQCHFCRDQVFYESREKHYEECPKFLIKCEKCQTPVERSKITHHEETVCANRMVTCPFPECNIKLPMDKFLAHICKEESVAKHIVYLLDKSEVSEQRLQRLEQKSPGQHAEASSPAEYQDEASASDSQSEVSQDPGVGGGAQAEGGLFQEDRQKLKLHEDLMSVLHSEILRCITKGEALGRGMEKSDHRLRDCYAKIEAIDGRLNTMEARYTEVAQRPVNPAECGELVSDGNGLFTWIIKGYGQVKRDATQREQDTIYSPAFLTCPGGYSMKLKLYANGEGKDMNKNVSLFLQTVKGPNDDLLLWPFSPKVLFMLVDQVDFRRHHVKMFEADPKSPASRRPTEDSIAAGCPAFISLQDMEEKMPLYWPKDTLYLRFHVGLPKKNQDRMDSLNPLKYVTSAAS